MPKRCVVVLEVGAPSANATMHNHPTLDIRGGGDQTFTVALNNSGNPAAAILRRACNWELSDEALATMIEDIGGTSEQLIEDPLPGASNNLIWWNETDFSY